MLRRHDPFTYKSLMMIYTVFEWGVGRNGADFGTHFTMADEDYKELNHCPSYDSKDVEFSCVETEQERTS